uniref:26S proteasome non-ATPase regulatory subunit 6 n=1 Tax=Globodera pallida TaxID=36090 RepID=A0A183BWY7_GLOPA
MTSSGEQPCYALVHVANDVEFPSEGQLKDKFEHGDTKSKTDALKTLISMLEAGEKVTSQLMMYMVRFCLPTSDHELKKLLLIFWKVVPKGGDWDRKNQLRCCEALYNMAVRDLSGAASLFLEAVPTFDAEELMDYETMIFYTVLCSIYALDRPDLEEKVINNGDIQQQQNPLVKRLLTTFYNSEYGQFFLALAEMEKYLKQDRYMNPHYQFYTRALRVRAYQQFLTPYNTVSLEVMANCFGVSVEFVDKELFMFISSGALNVRIDAVKGVVEMGQMDGKNQQYKKLLHDGDILLNRIQKLSRVINV